MEWYHCGWDGTYYGWGQEPVGYSTYHGVVPIVDGVTIMGRYPLWSVSYYGQGAAHCGCGNHYHYCNSEIKEIYHKMPQHRRSHRSKIVCNTFRPFLGLGVCPTSRALNKRKILGSI